MIKSRGRSLTAASPLLPLSATKPKSLPLRARRWRHCPPGFVACVMPTQANRTRFWQQAIDAWTAQTYPHRRLLIACEDAGALRRLPRADGIELLQCPDLRTLGQKRNWLNDRAVGDFIAHWDDDDWSDPRRLEDQIGRLQATGKAVTGYRVMEFHGATEKWLYSGTPQFVLGTSLCYRREWWHRNQFEMKHIGEDNSFVMQAAAARQLAVADGRGMMIARDHDANTSPRARHTKQWTKL